MDKLEYINNYLLETAKICQVIDRKMIEKTVNILLETKTKGGRVFFLGIGGGAGSGSHAANDFNKIANIPTICLTDNPALLTALINDEGWEVSFKRQLEMQRLNANDCLFIYSVGGGSENTSKNLVVAIDYAKSLGAKVVGVVGKTTGATAKKADACIIVPHFKEDWITPHTEDFQLIIDHLLCNLIKEIKKNGKE